MKAIVYLWDVPPGGGATGLVPGSHRLPEGPRQTLYGRYTRGDQDVGGLDDGDNSIVDGAGAEDDSDDSSGVDPSDPQGSVFWGN